MFVLTCTSECSQVECILETYNLIYTECAGLNYDEWIALHCIDNNNRRIAYCPHKRKLLAISLLRALYEMEITILSSTSEHYQSMSLIQNQFRTIITALPQCLNQNGGCSQQSGSDLVPLGHYLPTICWDIIWERLFSDNRENKDRMSSLIIAVLMLELLRIETPDDYEFPHLVAKLCATDSVMLCNLIKAYTNDILYMPYPKAHEAFTECAKILDCLYTNDVRRTYVAFSENTIWRGLQQIQSISKKATSTTGQDPLDNSILFKNTLKQELEFRFVHDETKMECALKRENVFEIYNIFRRYNEYVRPDPHKDYGVMRYYCIEEIRKMFSQDNIQTLISQCGHFFGSL